MGLFIAHVPQGRIRASLGLTTIIYIQSVTSPFFKDMLALCFGDFALEILLSEHTTTRSRNTRLFILHILNLSLSDFK